MSEPVIEVRDLHLQRGARPILTGATFQVQRGEIVVLMGASGSGKTTLLRSLAGLESFDAGSVQIEDVRLTGQLAPDAVRNLRRKVGMVFQFHCLFEHLPALQNVWLAPVHVQHAVQVDAEKRALELLRTLGVEHRAKALPRELSGGEAQRVAIARALATEPPVLLMDEPTASLDPARRVELGTLLRSLVGQHRTLVIATHDEEFATHVATRVLSVVQGRVIQSS